MTVPVLRWTRRSLDGILLASVLVVTVIGVLGLVAPAIHGQTVIVDGGSMEPAIPRGAFVLAVPGPLAELRVGDVVTVREGTRTPFTHRIVRFAQLPGADGPVDYVETKGDANAAADPVLVPASAILGRVEIALPLLGFAAAILALPAGLLGFLATCLTVLVLAWLVEDLEDQRACPACRAEAARILVAPSATPAVAGPAGAGERAAMAGAAVLAGSVAFPLAVAGPPARVRATGRARSADVPVVGPRAYDRPTPIGRGLPERLPGPIIGPAPAARPAPAASGPADRRGPRRLSVTLPATRPAQGAA